MIFFVSSGKMAFLLLGGKWKMIVLKNKWKYDVFCIFGKDGISFFFLQTWNYPPVKKAKIAFSRKIHLKMSANV